MQDSNPIIKAKRRAGRAKRFVKRRIYERNIGKQYRAWLDDGSKVSPATTDHFVTISVIVPVYNPPVAYLRDCLESVVNQQARNWQLVVANDGSTKAEVNNYLIDFIQQHQNDPRIKVITKPNGGISSALNAALECATGEYVGMLDHDDMLDPRCIEAFSQAIEKPDQPDAVYSDEDKINSKGEHFELYCKPDFSPELLLTQMYLCHFTIFRTASIREIGGLRSEMDGAQDFDLALRLLPHLANVVHLARPYYHWRAWSESTALTIDAKPWAQDAAARAQRDHLQRTFDGGEVKPSRVPGLNEVHPRLMSSPRVSVVIPTIGTTNTQGTARFVDDAVESLAANERNIELEFVIVTTGVVPDVTVDVGHHSIRHVVYDTEAFNFAAAINIGRTEASGEWLLILNDDTTVAERNPVTRMLEIGQIDGVAIVGCKLTYPDTRLQHVGLVLLPSGPTHAWIGKAAKEPGYFGSTLTPRNYLAVTGAAMLVETQSFDELGGFDEVFARDFNDVDFCLRAHQAGYRVAWTPYAHLTHHEGASMTRRKADQRESVMFAERWGTIYHVDPYYSSALNPALERIYEAL